MIGRPDAPHGRLYELLRDGRFVLVGNVRPARMGTPVRAARRAGPPARREPETILVRPRAVLSASAGGR